MIETSGKYWAAERVEEFFLLTICCILYISNQYSITTKIDKEHPGSMPRAQTGGMSSVSEFSFTETYSFMTTARIDTSGSRYCGYLGHNTAEAMMDILRDKENGINMEGIFMATGSMVITGTPDPERSVFKPFVFVKDIKQLKQNSSLGYGPDDTVKKIPCFQSKPHRKHPLFVKHDVDMLKQHLKTSVRKLKLGHKWEWAKIHPTYCGKLVEGYPKCLTQIKQFKGIATKY
uniref:Secernin 3 n=1 Tax=Oncorhynchus kisutch TaxID=8019 RepID=A0A8C7HZU0_ONCKI